MASTKIVSISLNSDMYDELERLKDEMGFAGRSEMVRAGIRAFVQEEKQKRDIAGEKNAILLVMHADEFDGEVAGIKHDYEDLITTHLHNKIEGDRCAEIFVLSGDGERIKGITHGFQTSRKMDDVRLLII